MTKLAEIAALFAKEAATTNWTGQHATSFIPAIDYWTGDTTIETAVKASTDGQDDEPAEQGRSFRDELFAVSHLMPVNGGEIHYGTPESYGNTDLPICRQGHGNHCISYYRPVDLPVTCTNCITRFGSET
jgi:hypothetical protein